jgi:hypothetical protein
MSTTRSRTPLSEVAAAVVAGTALVLLTLAVLVAMHVLTSRLLPDDGAQGQPAGASVELRVPSHEIGPVPVPERAAAPATMGA